MLTLKRLGTRRSPFMDTDRPELTRNLSQFIRSPGYVGSVSRLFRVDFKPGLRKSTEVPLYP